MNKIRVLQMFVANAKGGRTQYMLNTWENINKEKFHFDFVTLSKQLDFKEDLEKQGCIVHFVSCYAEENEQQFIDEIDKILSDNYDVVHIHFSFWRSSIIEERARKAGIKKIILHAHNFGIGGVGSQQEAMKLEQKHFEHREKISSDMADSFLACSREAAVWMYGDKIEEEKIQVIKNGIDLSKFKFEPQVREKVRSEFKLEGKYVIGNIGRFVYQKNHEFLIDVFYELCKLHDDVVLLLIGIGELQDEIKAKVKELGIENKVMFLNKRNDINELMQGMDLFALPSRFDGFPLSLLEAQASGLPCLAGNVPKEACLNNRNKVLQLKVETWVQALEEEYCIKERNFIEKEILGMHDIKCQVACLEQIYSQ